MELVCNLFIKKINRLIRSFYFVSCSVLQGYTPLHLAMQFGKDNIFELLCNVYSKYMSIRTIISTLSVFRTAKVWHSFEIGVVYVCKITFDEPKSLFLSLFCIQYSSATCKIDMRKGHRFTLCIFNNDDW